MTRVGIAVVGAGYWGINHVRVFAEEPGSEVRWVCDPDPRARARAEDVGRGARTTDELDRVLADPAVAAVVIASPAATHAALACRALAAGKHVLVEKPLALTEDDAARVAAAATAAGRSVLVGHLMLFHPALVRLREILRSGELGELHYLHTRRVNLGILRRDENALWSFGPHDVSMIDYLVGHDPLSVAARGEAYLQPGVADVVFLTMRYPAGVMAHVHLSWLDPRKERRLTLVGSQKMAELDDVADDKLQVYDRGYDRPPEFTRFDQYLRIRQGGVHVVPVTMEEPLRLMARHFLACARGDAAPRVAAADGVRIVRVLTALQQSLERDGAPVPLPSKLDPLDPPMPNLAP